MHIMFFSYLKGHPVQFKPPQGNFLYIFASYGLMSKNRSFTLSNFPFIYNL